jgi:hypothetical protein
VSLFGLKENFLATSLSRKKNLGNGLFFPGVSGFPVGESSAGIQKGFTL